MNAARVCRYAVLAVVLLSAVPAYATGISEEGARALLLLLLLAATLAYQLLFVLFSLFKSRFDRAFYRKKNYALSVIVIAIIAGLGFPKLNDGDAWLMIVLVGILTIALSLLGWYRVRAGGRPAAHL